MPARNTVFLSLALGWAEVLGARDIFIGVNAVDYSGYPDCRPEFVAAFERMANLATKAGVEGQGFRIQAPLQNLSKAQIVREGSRLGVDYAMTVSCYQADDDGRACGKCDSCRLRSAGFAEAGLADPTLLLRPAFSAGVCLRHCLRLNFSKSLFSSIKSVLCAPHRVVSSVGRAVGF